MLIDPLAVNPLTREHVLISPHRTKRPWQGQTEAPQPTNLPQYDPKCYLCPGNERAGGARNEPYTSTFVFPNDYASVLPPPMPATPATPHPLLTIEPVIGGCDVIIFHPRHDLTLARLSKLEIENVIEAWCSVYTKRGHQEGIEYVQIFEVRLAPPSHLRQAEASVEQRLHDGLLESPPPWAIVVVV